MIHDHGNITSHALQLNSKLRSILSTSFLVFTFQHPFHVARDLVRVALRTTPGTETTAKTRTTGPAQQKLMKSSISRRRKGVKKPQKSATNNSSKSLSCHSRTKQSPNSETPIQTFPSARSATGNRSEPGIPGFMKPTMSSTIRRTERAFERNGSLAEKVSVERLTSKLENLEMIGWRAKTPVQPAKKELSFLDLPLEIRQLIYSFCAHEQKKKRSRLWQDGVCYPEPSEVLNFPKFRPSLVLAASGLAPKELLLTCRQIRAEATVQISGELNASMRVKRYRFDGGEQLQKWFQRTPLRAVRRLMIHNLLSLGLDESETLHGILPAVNNMPSLQTMEMFMSYNWKDIPVSNWTHEKEDIWESQHWGTNISHLKEKLKPQITLCLYFEQNFFYWCHCQQRGCPLWIENEFYHGGVGGFPEPDEIFNRVPKWMARLLDHGFELRAPVTLREYSFCGIQLTRQKKQNKTTASPSAFKT